MAIGVEAEMLPVGGGGGGVSMEGDGGAGEVEGAVVKGGDNLYGIGVGDVFGATEDPEGSHVDCGVDERGQELGDVVGVKEGLVALDVDVDVSGEVLGDGEEAVGAAGEVG